MVCGGFTCSKNALAALNILYILVGFILIGVASVARATSEVTDLAVVGGIIACGVFLLIVAVIGLIGAVKHHQVLLFFYMIILFLVFLIQFAVACACLAINTQQQIKIATSAWKKTNNQLRSHVQYSFNCCGFRDQRVNGDDKDKLGHPPCDGLNCCANAKEDQICGGNVTTVVGSSPCHTCMRVIEGNIDQALKITGGIGLFFSLTEIVGVWLALRYRNQKDPRANPSAFL